ncbi:hypothetical protein PoB_002278800 [Plakobranchus ocellatus]|uniref:Secreted protein n=1 Tax=Plakobranchus ocellatus TaxID=259542 RepID=A0AAV3ZNX0_9GAST|nr:hypothetical protein PoB_002278800 [Plakobranchus ocellatus]
MKILAVCVVVCHFMVCAEGTLVDTIPIGYLGKDIDHCIELMKSADQARHDKLRKKFVGEIDKFIFTSVEIENKKKLLKAFKSRLYKANAAYFFDTQCSIFTGMISVTTKQLHRALPLKKDTFYRFILKKAVEIREAMNYLTFFIVKKDTEAVHCFEEMKNNTRPTHLERICASLFSIRQT